MKLTKLAINSGDMIMTTVLTIIGYLVIFGFQSLDVNNINLVMSSGDLTQSYLGSMVFRYDEWHAVLAKTNLIGYPYGISIANTDSLPIVAIILKVLRSCCGLAVDTQFIGIWSLLSFILTGVASVLIFRHLFQNKTYIVMASLFFIFSPIIICRAFAHNTLIAHWLVLFSFGLYLNNQLTWRTWAAYSLILFLSIFIHPYFMPMSVAFLGALVLKKLLSREIKISEVMCGAMLLCTITLLSMYCLGVFETNAEGGGWRWYAMNLNALFSPVWSKSSFLLPGIVQRGEYEGDNYLGGGLIILFILTIPYLIKEMNKNNLWKNKEIIMAVCVLSFFALSTQIYFNNHLLVDFNGGIIIDKIGDVFRASGRLFWPVWYMLIYYMLFLLKKYYQPNFKYVLPLLLLIQILDLYPLFKEKHDFIKEASSQTFQSRFDTPEWNRLLKKYPHVITFNKTYYEDLWFIIPKWNITISNGYVNREYKKISNFHQRVFNNLIKGCFNQKDSIIILDDETFQKLQKESNKKILSQVKSVNDIRYILPQTGNSSLCRENYLPLGKEISFNQESYFYDVDGLSWIEEKGRWSDGKKVYFNINVPQMESDIKIDFELSPFFAKNKKSQQVDVYIEESKFARWKFKKNKPLPKTALIIPKELLEKNNNQLKFKFKIKSPQSPRSLGLSEDSRKLGVRFITVKISTVNKGRTK